MGQIIARAWTDSAFKQKLLTDTVEVLKAEGLEIPAGIKLQAMENTDRVFHLVLPPKPAMVLLIFMITVPAGGAIVGNSVHSRVLLLNGSESIFELSAAGRGGEDDSQRMGQQTRSPGFQPLDRYL